MLTTFTQKFSQVKKDIPVNDLEKSLHSASFLVNLFNFLLFPFKPSNQPKTRKEKAANLSQRLKNWLSEKTHSYEQFIRKRKFLNFRYRIDMDDGPVGNYQIGLKRTSKESKKTRFEYHKNYLIKVKKSMGNTTLLQSKMLPRLAFAITMLLVMFSTAFAQLPTVDVRLRKAINKSKPTVGEQVTYTLYLKNEGTTTGHNIVVEDKLPIAGVTYLNGTASSGSWSYTNATGVGTWTVASLAAGDSVKLTINANVLAEGVYFNFAEVKSMTEEDYDSVPNNKKLYEDDIATACFSVPIVWYLGDEYTVSIPAEYVGVSKVVWYRNGQPITANTTQAKVNSDGTLTIMGIGSYTFTSDVSSCSATGCCAIELIDGTKFDLALRKTSDATSAMPGQDVTFKIQVFNQGNVNATQVQVTDYVPNGFTLNDTDWALSGNMATLKTPIATIAANGSATVEITLKVNANLTDGTSLVNLAEISSAKGPNGETVTDIDSNTDNNPSNDGTPKDDVITENGKTGGDEDDSDPATITIINEKVFDLALMKTTAATEVNRGDVVPFTITVYNQGTDQASNIKVVDYIPAGFELADNSWTLVGTKAYKTITGPLAPGGSANLTISLKVKADAAFGTLTNLAEVAEATNGKGEPAVDIDSNLDNVADNDGTPKNDVIYENGKNGGDEDDHDPASVTVKGNFDLALKKVLATTGVIKPGDNITFTITVYNQGDMGATAIQVTDYIPVGLTLNDANWQQTGTLATLKTPIATLAAGASTNVTIGFKVDATFAGTSLVNSAEISSAKGPQGETVTDIDSTPDQNSSNDGTPKDDVITESGKNGGDEDDQDISTVQINQVFDLALMKKSASTIVMPGEDVTFTITVYNQGTLEAKNVQLTDYIPTGFSLNDATWNLAGTKATLQLPIASILPGQSKNVTIKLKVNSDVTDGMQLVNAAEVKSAENALNLTDGDSTPDDIANNDGTPKDDVITENGKTGGDEDDHDIAKVTVENKVFDLALTKAANTSTVTAGGNVTYTITISNQGNMNATSIVVTDNIPAGLTLNDNNWVVSAGKAVLKTPIATLAAGQSTTVSISFTVNANATGSITNIAEITSSKGPNGENVTDKDSTPNNGNPNEDDQGTSTITVTPQTSCEQIVTATASDDNICVSESTKLKATTSNGTSVKWYLSAVGGTPIATTASGAEYTVEPSTTTTYYVELATVAQNCTNPRVPVIIIVNARPSNPTCGEAIEICAGETVNLNDHIINAPSTSGGVFEWHVGATSTSALVPNPKAVGAGKYYLFEKSGAGCYSNPTQVIVKEKPCDKIIDLSLIKTADKRDVKKGDIVTYTITVNNAGPNAATNVVVKDVLPSGIEFVSSSDFVNTANVLSASLPNISVGQTISLQFKAKVTGSGTIVNYAQVTAADQKDSDSTPGNGPTINEDDDDDEVIVVEPDQTVADLSLDKAISAFEANVGDVVTYKIKVTNSGPSIATNVEATDNIPAGLTFVSASGGDMITTVGSLVTAKFNSIAVGSTVEFTVVTKVATVGTISNYAQITKSDQSDIDSTPNNASTTEDDDDIETVVVKEICATVTPLISCANPYICAGGSATLTALGCTGGTVIWSNGQTGTAITVSPTVTTTYTAKCKIGNCTGNTSNPVTVVVGQSLIAPAITASTTTICAGNKTTLIAAGCAGVITWSNGMTGSSIEVSPTTTTTYTAKCKVADCESPNSNPLTITVGSAVNAPTIAASSSSICAGSSVTLKATGCTGTVTWSDGSTGATVTVTPTATTSYTATCTVGTCVSPASSPVTVTVTTSTPITIAATKEATCGGESVTLTVSGCTGTVTWNTGATGATLTVTPTATTTYTATCATATCSSTATKTITVGSGGTAPIITKSKDVVCEGESVVLTATGCSGTITWNTGATGNTLTVTPTATTTYTAICTTGTSCTGSSTITVNVRPKPTPPIVTCGSERICAGEALTFTAHNCDGIVTWSTGVTGTTMVVTPTETTVYWSTCTVNGCTSAKSTPVTITVLTQTPTITASTVTSCAGDAVTLTASNCSGTLLWNTGATSLSINVSPTATTTYSVECTVEGCKASASKTITVTAKQTPSITATKETICTGESVTLTAAGCTGNLSWSTGATTASITVSPTTTTTYTATCGSGACAGSATKTITVTSGAAPTITATAETTCGTESVTLTAAGCTGTITWNTGATGNTLTVTPTATTTYTATCGSGACAGSATKTITVSKPSAPTIAANITQLCAAGNVTLTATGCTGGTVVWSTGQTGASITVLVSATTTYAAACKVGTCESGKSNDVTIAVGNGETPTISATKTEICVGDSVTLTAAGCTGTLAWSTGATTASIKVKPTVTTTYTATCTKNGCQGSATSTISVNTGTTPTITATKETVCGAESVTLTAAGCTGTLSWSTGATTASITVTPTTTSTYTVTCGSGTCAKTASKTITVSPISVPTITANNMQLCAADSVTLTATGCTGGTVTWSNAMTGASIKVKVSSTTTYSATCKIGNCTSGKSNDVTITVTGKQTPSISATKETTCGGESVTLTATGCIGTVTWNTGATGNTLTVSPTATTTYTATCGSGTCVGSATKTITVSPNSVPTITATAETTCGTESVTLTASTCSGTITWNTGATGNTLTVTPTATTTYTATCGTGTCSASATKTITVNKPAAPTIAANVTKLCAAGNVTLTATGCTGGTVVWSTGQTGTSITVLVSATTTYAAACKVGTCESGKSNDVTITVGAGETPTIAASKTSICAGDSVTLTASGCTGTLAWSTGATTASIKVKPTVTTTYTATCTKNGCEGSATSTITVGTGETPTITASKDATCGGEKVTLTATGCTAIISWSTGATGNSIDVTPTATTTYTATCGTGACVKTVSKIITVTPTTAPTITANKTQLCEADSVILTATGCTGTVKWSNAMTGASIKVKVSANTTFSATCTNGSCVSGKSNDVTVTVGKPNAPTISASGTTVCSGSSVTLTATGCEGTVVWSNGLTGNTVTVSPVSKTIYTAVCKIGTAACTSGNSNEVTINVTGKPNAPVISCTASSICPGDTITFTALGCDGTVTWSTGKTGTTLTVSPTTTTAYTATCKIGDCVSAPSAPATVNVGNPAAPLVVCKNLQICAGSSTEIEAKGCIGTVVWSTGQKGSVITVSPTTMTSYSAYCDMGRCKSGESNILTVAVVGSVAKPTTKDLVNVCPNVTVDLTTGVTSAASSGGTYLFRTGNSATSPAVADPSKVTTGTYYVFEKVGNTCISQGAAINVLISTCETNTNCATNPATANAGKDSTICLSSDYFMLNGKIGGSATSSTWTSNGTGTFENSLSKSTKYFYSLADIQKGSVKFTLTTNDPDGSGNCTAATSSFTLTINAIKDKPTITTSKSPNICFGDSVTLTAPEAAAYLWSTGAKTRSIVIKTTGSYTVKLVNASGCCSVSSDAMAVNVRNSIPAPTVNAIAKNVCPATSVNLNTNVTSSVHAGGVFEFHTGSTTTSSMLANVTAVPAGDYYVFEKSDLGCYSTASKIKVTIDNCTTNPTDADIAVNITGSKAEIKLGDQLVYTLKITNNGPAAATNVKIINRLPAGLELVSATTGLTKVDATLNATIATIAVGETKTYTYTAKIVKTGEVANELELVSLTQVDPVSSNNYSVYKVQCTTCQEVCIATALAADTTKQANGNYRIKFTSIVQNCGNVDLSGVQLKLNLGKMFTSPTTFTVVQQPTKNSSSLLVVNPGFNGTTDTNLVNTTTSVLKAGKVDTVTYIINLVPNGAKGPFSGNTVAKGQGLTIFGTTAESSDVSNDGKTIDKASATPTVIKLFKSSSIGLALAVTDTVKQTNGCYNVTYKAIVKNNGSLPLTNVVISDSLFKAFPSPATFSLVGTPKVNTGSTLVINSAFTGNKPNVNLTTSASTLAVGKTDTLTYVVKLCPSGGTEFSNQAIVQGTGTLESGTNETVVDVSNEGYNPDAPGSNATKVIFNNNSSSIQIPCVGLALYVANIQKQTDASYNVTYKSLIRNCGNLNLSKVSICDTLSNTFGSPATATVVGSPTLNVGSTLKVNSTFDGKVNLCLLDSTASTLAPNKIDTLTWVVNVKTNGFNGPYRNNVTVTAKTPSGQKISDVSNDGTNSLPDGNNPTVINFSVVNDTIIGIAKNVKSLKRVDSTSNVFDVVFEFNVKNYSQVALSKVQIQDNLSTVFGDTVSIDSVKVTTTGTLRANSKYTGKGELINLLVDSTSTLAKGASQTVELFTRVDLLNAKRVKYENVALAIAKAGTKEITDHSTTGTTPDPNSDGSPLDNSIPTKVDFGSVITPAKFTPLGIAKAAKVDTVKNADGSYKVTFTVVVKNYGTRKLKKVQLDDELGDILAVDSTEFAMVSALVMKNTSTGLKLNSSFNGSTKTNLLVADSSSIAVGHADTITFAVKVLNKSKVSKTYENTISGSALDSTTTVTDISQLGLNPDANGNSNPGDDNAPTPFTIKSSGSNTNSSVVIIPEAISPNGDNKNDGWIITNIKETDEVKVLIYNRWGQLVFLDENYAKYIEEKGGWKGETNQGVLTSGTGVPDGTYFYCVESKSNTINEGKPLYNFITVAR